MLIARDGAKAMAAKLEIADEDIVRRILDGDAALFEVLMRRYNARVYRAVRSVLGGDADAEDAMQQAYLHAFQHLREFRGASRFSTWLLRIAMNEALMRIRRRSHLAAVPEETMERNPSEDPDPERQASARELVGVLEAALDELPQLYRTVLVLRDLEGLDTASAAEVLGVTEEVVKTRLHRAKAMLRERIADRVGEASAEALPFHAARCDRVVDAVMREISGTTTTP